MASPFFFVDKKDGKLRPCQDYRAFNEGTIKNTYLLPLISDLMDKLRGARYFTKLDIQWGYNNIRIKDGDQWKGAFKTKLGLFKPTVMFFGMCNSPTTFQKMTDEIFKDKIHKAWVIIYMDNIQVFTKDLHGNLGNITLTRRILQKLKDNDLYLKPEKCVFWATQVDYLGFILSENRIAMDPVKLKGIEQWTTLTTIKQAQSFLGFGNYYRKFIKDYGNLTKLLNKLLKKDKKFEWMDEAQQAFCQRAGTSTHWSLWQNMSTLTFWTHSTSPTLHTSLHIDVKLHFPQIASSVPPSVSTLKHRRKHWWTYKRTTAVNQLISDFQLYSWCLSLSLCPLATLPALCPQGNFRI